MICFLLLLLVVDDVFALHLAYVKVEKRKAGFHVVCSENPLDHVCTETFLLIEFWL